MIFNTAFSLTRSRFKSWPVIITDDTSNYSLADEYEPRSKYVWLYNDKYTVHENFDWNYFPERETNISIFPYCVRETKKPLSWNALRLVPTDRTRRDEEVKIPMIAAYRNSVEDIYMCNYSNTVKDFKRFKENKPSFYPAYFITSVKSFDDIIMNLDTSQIDKFVWLIDNNVNVSDDFDFSCDDLDTDCIYSFSVKHTSTKMSYAFDNLAMLVSKQYILDVQSGREIAKYTNIAIKSVVGTINDLRDPFIAWIYAYNTRMMMKDNVQREIYNTIERIYRKLNITFSGKYASKGFLQAQTDLDNNLTIEHGDMSRSIETFTNLKRKLETI